METNKDLKTKCPFDSYLDNIYSKKLLTKNKSGGVLQLNDDPSNIEYHGTIAIYDDVISHQTCDYILKECKKKGEFHQSYIDQIKPKLSNIRTSEELAISYTPNLKEIDSFLYTVFHEYSQTYLNKMTEMYSGSTYPIFDISVDDGYNLLKYEQGCYYKLHVDQDTKLNGSNKIRIVSALLYLNDVSKGGGTHFISQKITVQPKKGRIVMFPSSYSHAHESIPVESGEKYVIVTWFR